MHTATGFQLILHTVRALMLLALTYLPWINAQNFSAFSFHRLHQSQNSDFHIIKMTLAGCGDGREREAEAEKNRETQRGTHTDTERKTDRQIKRETERERERHRDTETEMELFCLQLYFLEGGYSCS